MARRARVHRPAAVLVAAAAVAVLATVGCTKELPPTRVPVAVQDDWTRVAVAPPELEPAGVVEALVGVPDGWLAAGWGTRSAGALAQPMVWRSSPGARFWDAEVLPGAGTSSGAVTSLRRDENGQLVAGGTVGRGADRVSVTWTSTDGRNWSGPDVAEARAGAAATPPAAQAGTVESWLPAPAGEQSEVRAGFDGRALTVLPGGGVLLQSPGDADVHEVVAEGLPRPRRRRVGTVTQLAATDNLAVAAGVARPGEVVTGGSVPGRTEARLWYSRDGLLWNEAVLSAGVRSIDALVVTPDGMFVARATATLPDGSPITVGFTSRDGINWASVPDPGVSAPGCDPEAVAAPAPPEVTVVACAAAPDGTVLAAGTRADADGSRPVVLRRSSPGEGWQPVVAPSALLDDAAGASLTSVARFGGRALVAGTAGGAPVILVGPWR